MVGNIMNFITQQIAAMFSCNPRNNDTNGSESLTNKTYVNWQTGLSCWAYCLPAIASYIFCLPLRDCAIYEISLYFMTSVNSFMADYVNSGKVSMFHAIDRWTATMTLLAQFAKAMILPLSINILIFTAFGTYCCIYCLKQSRLSTTARAFQFWHTLWHILGGLMIAYMSYVEVLVV